MGQRMTRVAMSPPFPALKLNTGAEMPTLGLGVYQLEPADAARVVAEGLEVGYRLIDTAQMYRNETGVGQAIRSVSDSSVNGPIQATHS